MSDYELPVWLSIPKSYLDEMEKMRADAERLWVDAEMREQAAREALARIADRAQRILDGKIETTAIGASDYNLQVAKRILGEESRR